MLQPDPKYNNLLVSKFINYALKEGKKFLAQRIVYKTFDLIKEITKRDPLEVFDRAIKNAAPRMETRPKRLGGATYQVPYLVPEEKQKTLAMKWILKGARQKKGESMEKKLAQEILLAAKGEGNAVRKRINTERMAEANKAFAHLAR